MQFARDGSGTHADFMLSALSTPVTGRTPRGARSLGNVAEVGGVVGDAAQPESRSAINKIPCIEVRYCMGFINTSKGPCT